jgi:hypothetical protein
MRSFHEWEAGRATRRRIVDLVRAAVPWPYERTRPRHSDERRILEERGVHPRLIGPSPESAADRATDS